MLRNQILQQIKPFKNERSMHDSHIWIEIEDKVVMLVKWVLCKKHMVLHEAAVQMTMRFLKQESGIFGEEQSVQMQSHLREPARINDNSASFGLGSAARSAAPYSAYISAASHLATPPMSPGTVAQEMVYQPCFASGVTGSLNDGATFGPSFKPPQESPSVLHMNMPVKTEPAIKVRDTDSRRTSRSTTIRAVANRDYTSNTNASREQHVPHGSQVRRRSSTRFPTDVELASLCQANPFLAQQPPSGPAVSPHAVVKASKQQHAMPKAPYGFTVRRRSADRAPVAQPCLTEASNPLSSAHDKHRDSFDLAGQDTSAQSPRSEIDELVEKLKAANLRNKELEGERNKLEDRVEMLQDDNHRLLVANKQLLDSKKRYKEQYQDAQDRLGELEGERDDLEDELDESREHVVRLEEELVVLRKPARGRSVRRREGR